MAPTFIKTSHLFVAVGLLAAFVAHAKADSIQSTPDQVIGNKINIDDGDVGIFNQGTSLKDFVATVYAVDAEVNDVVSWTEKEPNFRPLCVGDEKTDGLSSITWCFVAPSGKKFGGGSIQFQCAAIWDAAPIEVSCYSDYSNDSRGRGGYIKGKGTLYSQDAHSAKASWDWGLWIVSVPPGVSEFYVTVAKIEPKTGIWVNNMKAQEITIVAADSTP